MPTVERLDKLSPQLARALIRSLNRGTSIARGIGHIHIGHERWLDAQRELLAEIAEDTHSDTKFVRGAYGAGKSHFLSMVQHWARQSAWVTCHVECKADGVQIDRFETLYPRIAQKLQLPVEETGTEHDTAGLRLVLEKWAKEQAKRAGVRDNGLTRPFDADARIYSSLEKGLLRSNLPPDFVRALSAFARAFIENDGETLTNVSNWMSGAQERALLPMRYLQKPVVGSITKGTVALRAIGKGTSKDAMRGLLWLIKSSGFTGLVLCIDEVEELAKLGSRRRMDQALQALREYVDHAGGEGGFHSLCLYLAATPEMFEGEQYFPRYDALATRIQPFGSGVNWRGAIIDLDRTPLDARQMAELAARICSVHQVAYGSRPSDSTDRLVSDLVAQVSSARFRIARPRLLARVVVDALERARQGDAADEPDVSKMITRAVEQIAEEASS